MHHATAKTRQTRRLFIAAQTIVLWAFLLITNYAAVGDLDRSFGTDGISPIIAADLYSGNSFDIQPDGKIVSGGTYGPAANHVSGGFALTRYLPNGMPDSTFGNNGVVKTQNREIVSSANGGLVNDIAVLSDGRIAVVGYLYVPDGTAFGAKVIVVMVYNANGSRDTNFNNGSPYIYSTGGSQGEATEVVATGQGFYVTGYIGVAPANSNPYKALLFKFGRFGLDSSFAGGGLVIETFSTDVQNFKIALRPDGKILTSGVFRGTSPYSTIFFRYDANGNPDQTFGNNGRAIAGDRFASAPSELLIQPDGRFISIADEEESDLYGDFIMMRFNENGSPDTTFGVNGIVNTAPTSFSDIVYGAGLQADGKIIVSGYSYNSGRGNFRGSFLIRYLPSGTPDRSLGSDGIIFRPNVPSVERFQIQTDGKIIGITDKMRVIRLQGSGKRDDDYTGDRRADLGVFRPNTGEWFQLNIADNSVRQGRFGIAADITVAADYDGDGRTDYAVFREGIWYILNSGDNSVRGAQFGQAGDVPVAADYDGDGRADLAVYRQGIWYILNSADNSFRADRFGATTDLPQTGDFDADGKSDLAVFRDGVWYMLKSRENFAAAQFGQNGDTPVAADYDGDGRADFAVYRPSEGVWYLLRSFAGFADVPFGTNGDVPAPADYDGDGRVDLALFRSGAWQIMRSTEGILNVPFGTVGDRPTNALVRIQ